jgi:hypothetical protein
MTGTWKRLSALAAAGLVALTGQTAHSAPPPTTTGAKTVMAASSGSNVKISGWATFSGVNIAAGTAKPEAPTSPNNLRSADLIGAQLVYRPEMADLYMRWQVQKVASTSAGFINQVGTLGTLYVLKTVIRNIPIQVRVQSQGVTQQYQLYKCENEAACTYAADLSNGCPGATNPCGGFGTTGEEVVLSIPLSTLAANGLALNEGDTIGTPQAGTYYAPIASPQLPDQLSAKTINMAKTAKVTVPAKKLSVTVGKVTKVAPLVKGYFSVLMPRSAFKRNPSAVTTRTCLGTSCVNQTFSVRY